jgi:hypothetical protein
VYWARKAGPSIGLAPLNPVNPHSDPVSPA